MKRADAERLALLELLVRGSLRKRRAQASRWEALAELPWVRRTGRRGEIRLVEARRADLVALLDRTWPDWGVCLASLTARGLEPTPEGWVVLQDALRAENLPALPDRLNRRTAAALLALHSKAILTSRRLASLGRVDPTRDGSVRVRPPAGLVARTAKGSLELANVSEVLGEVSLPERAFRDGIEFDGRIRGVLLIENLGAYCDLTSVDGWLFAHVPGWDTATAALLLQRLRGVPMLHFGDLDPNGMRIFHHLREVEPHIRWFVPSFWAEFVEARGLPGRWPDDLDLTHAPDLVRLLAVRHLWLEQECIAVDPRTAAALESSSA